MSARRCFIVTLALLLQAALTSDSVQAQLLYSFETSLDGFEPQGGGDSDYLNHVQSTIGATDGSMALEIETGSGFGRDVVVNETSDVGGAAYDLFNTVAADPSQFTLDFDVTFTQAGWDRVTDPGGFFQLNVFSNSDSTQGFEESFGVVNGNAGSPSFVAGSLPATALSLVPDSEFFQLGFGSNSSHTQGPANEGVLYYVDNIRFTQAPTFIEETLFSWETPDDVGTPGVNEQLEGWVDGFSNAPYFHDRTITSEGATDGASGLQLVSPDSGFAWGSQFVLDSGEEGNPSDQAQIDELIGKVNDADRIAFDVTFPEEQFPEVPTFLSLFLNVSDQSGAFYQSPAKQAGNPVSNAENTVTIEVPLSELSAGGVSIADVGLEAGTFFRIALATNSDDGNTFIIDNFRLLSLEGSDQLPGDANGDGSVDLLDLDILGSNFGITEGATFAQGDFNEDGAVDLLDLDILGSNFGTSAPASVPEPTTIVLALGLMAGAVRSRR